MNIQNLDIKNLSKESKTRILFFLILFLLSSIGMFGQTNSTSSKVETTQEIIITNDIVSVNSQIEFVSWFMGTKQSKTMDVSSTAKEGSKVNTRKQILYSGSTPNKVLYKTLMKKVSSQNSAIV